MAEKKPRIKMTERPAAERIRDFEEAPLGYTVEQAIEEAKRCLLCKDAKCVAGCPVEDDIPGFLRFIAQGDFDAAVKKIKETNSLPAICGRVCPQEEQCELKCIIGIKGEPVGIGNLERFAADWERENQPSPARAKARPPLPEGEGKKVAVVGSRPARGGTPPAKAPPPPRGGGGKKGRKPAPGGGGGAPAGAPGRGWFRGGGPPPPPRS